MLKKIAYEVMRYYYLMLGLTPIATIIWIVSENYTVTDGEIVSIFNSTDSNFILMYWRVWLIGTGVILGASSIQVFQGKTRWLFLFSMGCFSLWLIFICFYWNSHNSPIYGSTFFILGSAFCALIQWFNTKPLEQGNLAESLVSSSAEPAENENMNIESS